MRAPIVLIALLVATVACASGQSRASPPASSTSAVSSSAVTAETTTTSTTTSTIVTTTTAGPAPALAAFVASLSQVVEHTAAIADRSRVVALAARQLSRTDREVDVLSWSGTAWATVAALTLPYPWYSLAELPIQVADVTGDGRPDFLVRVEAADNEPGVVVSDDGGTWRLVPLSTRSPPGPEDVYAGRNPSFVNGQLTTEYNDCTPNCAYGKTSTVVWAYDRVAGRFVST